MPSSEVNLKIQDEGRLAELGYTQELRREWSLLHNFGASFSIIVRDHEYNLVGVMADTAALAECGDRYHNVREYYNILLGTCVDDV